MAVISQGRRWGFVNRLGQVKLLPPGLGAADYFTEGLLAVYHEKPGRDHLLLWGFVDREGQMVIPLRYDMTFGFSEGLAPVKLKEGWGFIDKKGNFSISRRFFHARPFSEGLVKVMTSPQRDAYIDEKGSEVLSPPFPAGSFREGMAIVLEQQGHKTSDKYGFMNKSGKVVIKPSYTIATHFSEGLALVRDEQAWGYIDKSGKLLINARYELARSFSEGLAAVQLDGKWGFIDRDDDLAIAPRFEDALDFYQGLAAVKLNGKWGFIDHHGNMVIEPQFDEVKGSTIEKIDEDECL